MVKRINLDKIDEKVKEFLMSLKLGEDQYILELGGKPFAGLVAPEQAEKMVRAKDKLFEAVDKMWKLNKHISAKKVQKDIADAVKAVRH
jgi:hypothetical protein